MEEKLQRLLPLPGRILISLIFFMSGIGKIFDFSGTTAYMENVGNMPMASILLVGAIVLELAGGLSIILGFKARIGAILLMVFLIPATLIFHDFWTFPEEQQKIQMIMFMKNLSIFGALLTIVAYGSGPFSLDGGTKGDDTA